jgi:hypothetical protein
MNEKQMAKRMLQCALDADYSQSPDYVIIREEMTIERAEEINSND